MEFELSTDLQDLQQRARMVAAEGVAEFGRFNDSWINGFSKDFALRMAEGEDEHTAITFANAAAALKCTRNGGRSGCPVRAEVNDFLVNHPPVRAQS